MIRYAAIALALSITGASAQSNSSTQRAGELVFGQHLNARVVASIGQDGGIVIDWSAAESALKDDSGIDARTRLIVRLMLAIRDKTYKEAAPR